ncbi:coiled-coil domain-containing protein [Candidatus Auribacterota bacterium]
MKQLLSVICIIQFLSVGAYAGSMYEDAEADFQSAQSTTDEIEQRVAGASERIRDLQQKYINGHNEYKKLYREINKIKSVTIATERKIDLYKGKMKRLEAQISEVDSKIRSIQSGGRGASSLMRLQVQRDLDNANKNKAPLFKKLEKKRKILRKHQTKKSKLDTKFRLKNSRHKHLEKSLAQMKAQIQQAELSLKEMRQEFQEAKNGLGKIVDDESMFDSGVTDDACEIEEEEEIEIGVAK